MPEPMSNARRRLVELVTVREARRWASDRTLTERPTIWGEDQTHPAFEVTKLYAATAATRHHRGRTTWRPRAKLVSVEKPSTPPDSPLEMLRNLHRRGEALAVHGWEVLKSS